MSIQVTLIPEKTQSQRSFEKSGPIEFESKPKGTILPRTYSYGKTVADFDDELTVGLVTDLRGFLAKRDDLAKRIGEHEANLRQINSALAEATNSEDLSEQQVLQMTVTQQRLPLVESRVADLKDKLDNLGKKAAAKATELRDQMHLLADLIHHGNAALADTPETPVEGPWVGSPDNTFAFVLLEQTHYSRRSLDMDVEDIFELCRSFIDDAERLMSELLRLENEFKGDVPIRRTGEAAGFTAGKGALIKFANLRHTEPVSFSLVSEQENTFRATSHSGLLASMRYHNLPPSTEISSK